MYSPGFGFVFRLQQQVENIKIQRKKADEEVLNQKRLSDEGSTIKSQLIYIREKVSHALELVHLIRFLSFSLPVLISWLIFVLLRKRRFRSCGREMSSWSRRYDQILVYEIL